MVGRQNADTADTPHLRDIAMATVFGFLCMGCTLAPSGEYDCTVHVWRQCALKMICNDFLVVKVNCSTSVSTVIKSI